VVTTFDRDTTLVPLGSGRYRVTFTHDWWVAVGPNGGLVAAVLLRAAEAEVADPNRFPRTITVYYLSSPREGPAELHVTAEKAGRGVSFLSVRLSQGERACAVALVAVAADRSGEVAFHHQAPPVVPPPEACPRLSADEGTATIRDRWDSRWAMGPLPGIEGADAGEEVCSGGWIRLSEPRPIDAAVLVAMADAWIPPLLARAETLSSSVPTVELTVHLRDRKALADVADDDFCLVRFWSRTAGEGFLEEDGLVWAPDGRLLAQCRQLAILQPLPPEHRRIALRLEPPA
jgi:acyl-CoA thioesterase